MSDTPRLSQRLREATMDDHRRAEQQPFVRELLQGRLERSAYIDFVRDLREVYVALERGLREAPEGVVPGIMLDPRLHRVAALEADLDHLHGPDWRDRLTPTDEATAYAAALDERARKAPRRLAAHAYVRYLGDLSGGQAIGRVVQRAYGLEGGRGLAFYAFPDIENTAAFKDRFRAALDALGNGSVSDELVDEAREAFRRNGAIVEALQRRR
jgi:heme oxygenase